MNTTIFSGSGSTDELVEQTTVAASEYLYYVKICMLLFGIPVVIVPALSAIAIIVKDRKLQTNNNIFLINLLLTDVALAVVLLCFTVLGKVLYLLDVNMDCRILVIPIMTLTVANKLMFIPMCVDRFIHIAAPFSYKRIVTTKRIITTIITLWVLAIVATTFIYINEQFEYTPSAGICTRKQRNIPLLLILLLCFITPIVLITITSIYLRYRIIKSNNFFHSVKRSVAQQRKSHKAGRMAEILQEQVKPTLAVFRVGGIDAVLDILFALISAVIILFSPSSTMTFIVATKFVAIPIQYLQSANHALVYNPDIREKIIGCMRMRNKHSKVIMFRE